MQSLARDGYTADEVRALLTADSVQVSAGLDLLDAQNRLVADISDDLVGGEVERSNYATVHGTCRLQVMRELAWGRDRVRPWMTVGGVRFNLGVYVMTTPETRRGEDPATWDVTGFDLLHLLQDGPGDTYVIEADGVTTYLQAVQQIVTDSGVGTTLRLDGTGGATLLERDFVWCLTDSGPSWLGMANDLLSAINYRGIWANHDGELRSAPYAQPSVRPVEWVFDTSNPLTNIVGEDRTETADIWAAPNFWKFVRRGMATQPVDGNGLYFPPENANPGAPEATALGRMRRKTVYLDAADQASLVAQGNRIVNEDRSVSRAFELQVDPLPVAGHFDIVRLVDGGRSDKCQVSSWTLPLDGSPGRWTLAAVNG